MSFSQMHHLIRARAAKYMNSFPGADNIASNTAFHTNLTDLLTGKDQYKDKMNDLIDLGAILSYRLGIMAEATRYKDVLGLNYPDCNACEVEGWTHPLYTSKQPEAKEKLRRFNTTYECIDGAKLFSIPVENQGWDYTKPDYYLAIALVESQMSKEEVEEAINILKSVHVGDLAPKI